MSSTKFSEIAGCLHLKGSRWMINITPQTNILSKWIKGKSKRTETLIVVVSHKNKILTLDMGMVSYVQHIKFK